MTIDSSADPARTAHNDRRAFLRLSLGAVAAGAWVAPQVLSTPTAFAACTPLDKYLEIAGNCAQIQPTTGTGTCYPSGWMSGVSNPISYSCPGKFGGSITILTAGCTPIGTPKALKFCISGSGAGLSCVNGTIIGNTVTFPVLPNPNPGQCEYLAYRIKLACC